MNVDLTKISTEQRNPNTLDIDTLCTKDILKRINNEDKTVPLAVEKAIDQIAKVVDKVVECFKQGGRLIYMGAGTSGRIGILDAVECPPTFGVDYEMVQCLMAGGKDAFVKAKEGAEDSTTLPVEDLKNINISKNDMVIGIAASGRTPYVISGVQYAKSIGAPTACITTSRDSILSKNVDYPIEAITGSEALTGSTRMKSGTAQKLVCNMITTASMIKMGKVYENLMIDLKPTNEKLVARSHKILMDALSISKEEAISLLNRFRSVKNAIFAFLTGIDNLNDVEERLAKTGGNIREAIKDWKK